MSEQPLHKDFPSAKMLPEQDFYSAKVHPEEGYFDIVCAVLAESTFAYMALDFLPSFSDPLLCITEYFSCNSWVIR